MRASSGARVFRFRAKKIVGVFTRPAGPENARFPAVLMLHGLPGSEKSADLQRDLMAKGVAAYAMNFMGAWGSEGTYKVSTLVDQARAGLRFLARHPAVDPRRLAVFGFSMGGWAAIHAGALEPALKAVVAVSPAGGAEMVTPGMRAIAQDLARPLRVPSWRSMYADCVRAVRTRQPKDSAARMKPPLLLVHGTEDEVVPYAVSKIILKASRGRARLVTAPGARHDFLDRRPWLVRRVSSFLLEKLGARR